MLPVLERFFSRKERQTLNHSWAGIASVWLKACVLFICLFNYLAEMNRVVTLSGEMHLMLQMTIVILPIVTENLSHSDMHSEI